MPYRPESVKRLIQCLMDNARLCRRALHLTKNKDLQLFHASIDRMELFHTSVFQMYQYFTKILVSASDRLLYGIKYINLFFYWKFHIYKLMGHCVANNHVLMCLELYLQLIGDGWVTLSPSKQPWWCVIENRTLSKILLILHLSISCPGNQYCSTWVTINT